MGAVSQEKIKLHWLITLRWLAVGGQIGVLWLVVGYFRVTLPLGPILAVLSTIILSNILLWSAQPKIEAQFSQVVPAILLFDVISLSLLLYLSGGPSNPFSVVYLVHITLAGILLGEERWTWVMFFLSSSLYGLLFWYSVPIPELSMHHHDGSGGLHLAGMLVAFILAGALLGYFLTKLNKELSMAQAEVLRLATHQQQQTKLAAIANLAAGAAHELGGPLGTIAVVVGELMGVEHPEAVSKDLIEIDQQLKRARQILNQMSGKAGELVGELSSNFALQELIPAIRASCSTITLKLELNGRVSMPRNGLMTSLLALIKNSLDAQASVIEIAGNVHPDGMLTIVLKDNGSGMTAEQVARVGEPFFTTKNTQEGMGLGVFLVRSFVSELGGGFSLLPDKGSGMIATLSIPNVGEGNVGPSLALRMTG